MSDKKLFVIRKYVPARSAAEAMKIESQFPVAEVFFDTVWQNNYTHNLITSPTIGF